MNKPVLLLASLILASLTSCAGYQLGASKPKQMANVTKLAVPTFLNDTLEPRLEVMVTNALIKKLQMDGAYQIVRREDADAVLVGKVKDIRKNQFRAVRLNTLRPLELLYTMEVQFDVEDNAGVKLMSGATTASSNLVLNNNVQLTERQALADVAERLGTKVASQVSEGW